MSGMRQPVEPVEVEPVENEKSKLVKKINGLLTALRANALEASRQGVVVDPTPKVKFNEDYATDTREGKKPPVLKNKLEELSKKLLECCPQPKAEAAVTPAAGATTTTPAGATPTPTPTPTPAAAAAPLAEAEDQSLPHLAAISSLIKNDLQGKGPGNISDFFSRLLAGQADATTVQTDWSAIFDRRKKEMNNGFQQLIEQTERDQVNALTRQREAGENLARLSSVQGETKSTEAATLEAAKKASKEAAKDCEDLRAKLQLYNDKQRECLQLLNEMQNKVFEEELQRIERALESQRQLSISERLEKAQRHLGGFSFDQILERRDVRETTPQGTEAHTPLLRELPDGTYGRRGGGKHEYVVKGGGISLSPPVTSVGPDFDRAWNDVIDLLSVRGGHNLITFRDDENPSFDVLKRLVNLAHAKGVMSQIPEDTLAHLGVRERQALRQLVETNNNALSAKKAKLTETAKGIEEETRELNKLMEELSKLSAATKDAKGDPMATAKEEKAYKSLATKINSILDSKAADFENLNPAVNELRLAIDKANAQVTDAMVRLKPPVVFSSAADVAAAAVAAIPPDPTRGRLKRLDAVPKGYDVAQNLKPLTQENLRQSVEQKGGYTDKTAKRWDTHINEITACGKDIQELWKTYVEAQKRQPEEAGGLSQSGFENFLLGKEILEAGSKDEKTGRKLTIRQEDARFISAAVFASYKEAVKKAAPPPQPDQAAEAAEAAVAAKAAAKAAAEAKAAEAAESESEVPEVPEVPEAEEKRSLFRPGSSSSDGSQA